LEDDDHDDDDNNNNLFIYLFIYFSWKRFSVPQIIAYCV
jgi:hypothetical protein